MDQLAVVQARDGPIHKAFAALEERQQQQLERDIQKLEALQPNLAWKPLEVIKHTLENTTQWDTMMFQ